MLSILLVVCILTHPTGSSKYGATRENSLAILHTILILPHVPVCNFLVGYSLILHPHKEFTLFPKVRYNQNYDELLQLSVTEPENAGDMFHPKYNFYDIKHFQNEIERGYLLSRNAVKKKKEMIFIYIYLHILGNIANLHSIICVYVTPKRLLSRKL